MFNKKSKIIMLLLVISMVASQFTLVAPLAFASDVELLITGTGVNEEVSITSWDWSKYSVSEKIYSTNNSLGFHKIVKTKGYDLFSLIGENNLKTDKDYVVKFTCSDGFEFTKTISELKNTYYYSNFTEASKVKVLPMIAKYTQILADFPKDSFAPPVSWVNQSINEEKTDKDFPKLVFGQTSIDDMNMSKWGKEVVKITVGDEKKIVSDLSLYKHINKNGSPYNVDAITGATFTIEGPAVEGYRAVSLRQIEEDVKGQKLETYIEKVDGKIMQNSYEGINVKYLIDNYVDAKDNAGNITFKDKSRKTIMTVPIEQAENYVVAYGVNEVPLVYLNTEEGYIAEKQNDNGCFKLVYEQSEKTAKEFSNVAYIYIEEKDAKNIYEHSYAPYNDSEFSDYEFIIHGDGIGKEVRYTVSDIESMTSIQTTEEYSLSNSEYFWYYNTFKGVRLWDLLLKSGLDPNIDENTSVRFIAADNYNFAPMTIKQIKDDSLYGYYEKSAMDTGDGTFPGEYVNPIHTNMPVLVAYGFNGYPYVTRPGDEGYNPGLGNDGGPLRIIFGKTNYNDTNGSNQVQFAKEVIIGEGTSVLTDSQGTGEGQETQTEITKNSSWGHNQGLYTEYLDMPVLRVTGSQVKEPMTFTLRQIEALKAIRDTYNGDGVHDFEGVVLWDLISQTVGLKDEVDVPSIRVFSGQNYNQILRSNDQVINGVLNSKGQIKDIILAYAIDGSPLVKSEGDIGYSNNNAYGPLRLIVEESKSMWVKWTDCIVVGTGDYEAPEMKDVKADKELFNDILNHWAKDDILKMASMGYAKGSNGMFRPEENITRAEFVTLMVRVLGTESLGTLNTSFADVNESDWFANYVSIAASNGYVKGYENGQFKPNSPITREEIASIIGARLNGNLTTQESDEILSSYTDEISGWAKISVASAVKAEIIKGLPDNLFGGRQNATRAQAIVMLSRFINNK